MVLLSQRLKCALANALSVYEMSRWSGITITLQVKLGVGSATVATAH